MGGVVVEEVKRRTPVGVRNPFDPRQAGYTGGELRESMVERPVVEGVNGQGEATFETGVESFDPKAEFVEEGTGKWGPLHRPYVIVPRKPGGFLVFYLNSPDPIYARRVVHPGSPGAHMIRFGLDEAEARFEAAVEPIVEEWAREVSNRNRKVHVIGRVV